MTTVSAKARGALLGVGLLAGCSGMDEGRANAWTPGDEESGGTGVDVDPVDESSGGASDEKGESGGACMPGESGECLCDDGLHLGEQTCADDGSDWGPCVCEGDPSGGTSGGESGESSAGESGGETSGAMPPAEVCFLGADMAGTTCFPVTYPDMPPAGYEYPPPLNGDANYRAPIGYIDLEAVDLLTYVAPNFQLGELAQVEKGRWGVVQPHAVEKLQDLRNAMGSLTVNSGYRSVEYNAGVGGATYSRHMYGDGFDLDPASGDLTGLENQCTSIGGMLVEYETHVHCDFRSSPVDEVFFGSAGEGSPSPSFAFAATIHCEDGVCTTTNEGFDEGEPTRRWTAHDELGDLIVEAMTPVFVAPLGTVRVEVDVGRRVSIAATL